MKDKLLGLYGALAAMGGTSYSASPIVTGSQYVTVDTGLGMSSASYQSLMEEIEKHVWQMGASDVESIESIDFTKFKTSELLPLAYGSYQHQWSKSTVTKLDLILESFLERCSDAVGTTVLPEVSRATLPYTITDDIIQKKWVDAAAQRITIPYEVFTKYKKKLISWDGVGERLYILMESNNFPGKAIPFVYDEKFLSSGDESVNFVFMQPMGFALGKNSTASDSRWTVVVNRKKRSAGQISSYTNPYTIY